MSLDVVQVTLSHWSGTRHGHGGYFMEPGNFFKHTVRALGFQVYAAAAKGQTGNQWHTPKGLYGLVRL